MAVIASIHSFRGGTVVMRRRAGLRRHGHHGPDRTRTGGAAHPGRLAPGDGAERDRVELIRFDPPPDEPLGQADFIRVEVVEWAALARTFARMADEVRARAARLQAEVRERRIEIDEAKQSSKVQEITGSDYFKDLKVRAVELRHIVRDQDAGQRPPNPPAP